MKVVKVFVPSALAIWISVAAKVWLWYKQDITGSYIVCVKQCWWIKSYHVIDKYAIYALSDLKE
jgi:hypothetical protein